jgi:hypothetical protein
VRDGAAQIRFYVNHPDLGADHPVEVILKAEETGEERRMEFIEAAYREERFEIPDSKGQWTRIEINVHPTFTEPNGGRTLGIAVYEEP